MSVFSRLYTGTGAFDIVGRRKTWYVAFGLLVLICVASIVFRGFNLGIDFTGGTQIQFPANTATAPATVPAVQDVFQQAIDVEPASVQTAGTGPAAVVLIRSETLSLAQTITVKQALFDAFGPQRVPEGLRRGRRPRARLCQFPAHRSASLFVAFVASLVAYW